MYFSKNLKNAVTHVPKMEFSLTSLPLLIVCSNPTHAHLLPFSNCLASLYIVLSRLSKSEITMSEVPIDAKDCEVWIPIFFLFFFGHYVDE